MTSASSPDSPPAGGLRQAAPPAPRRPRPTRRRPPCPRSRPPSSSCAAPAPTPLRSRRADARRPLPPAGARRRTGGDVPSAALEAVQAQERARRFSRRVSRPSAHRLQPDGEDRRRGQPGRPRRAGRSDRPHARRGDQDARCDRDRRPGRRARRHAVDRRHLGRLQRQPLDAEQEPRPGAGDLRRRRPAPGVRRQGVHARSRQPADRHHPSQGQPADGRRAGAQPSPLRRQAPLRLADERHRGLDQEADPGRPARLLRRQLPPQQRGADRRRRHHRGGAARQAGGGVQGVARQARRRPHGSPRPRARRPRPRSSSSTRRARRSRRSGSAWSASSARAPTTSRSP